MSGPRTVAVVGSGVAGLTAAYVASRTASVTLYEADDRLGGHADTHLVAEGADGLAIDTGFIVHNERTYPTLLRLLRELGVETQPSQMSLSVRDDVTGLEYAGALGPRGLFPAGRNAARPAYLRMLTEIPRFHRQARILLSRDGDDLTLREFLDRHRFPAYFRRHFMEPLVASVWSCDPAVALDYPARYLFTFLEHHGMLGVLGSPQWRTVTGGSRTYVERVAASIAEVRTGTKVTSVLETPTGVEVTDGNGAVATYDAVVVATHPGQALTMLAEPTVAQREVLGAIPYSANVALLHTDMSLLPRAERARASWNFRRPADARDHVTVTYDLTRLQRLPTDTHYLVTLGGEGLVDPAAVIDRMEYEHPLYTPASVAAQRRLPGIDTDRVAFAGAYHGWGFHEDGARSGLAAVERLGLSWGDGGFEMVPEEVAQQPSRRAGAGAPSSTTDTVVEVRGASATSLETTVTGVYATTIRHTRRTPVKRSFTHRSHTWLVDLDDLPDHGVLGRFEARDHLGDPGLSIRENLSRFLKRHDVELGRGRVLMAAHPRALGYCFNPISVFWVRPERDDPCVVVEVHNTYGDRHAYLVHPDERARATTPKAMYVSPFHGVDGRYQLAVPVPDERLHVAVTLLTDDGATFSASLSGYRTTHRAWRAAPAALRGAALIRLHGIALWLRRLPIRPRPDHHQEGVR
ncbi:FAD-dependent oxidoreductase [Nocardioides sp. LMS-CY]|uniref:FAD-dependent oxidoreductase n=1 Tax=Nocardioides sp. (strain LMS-CY) TaxID=2840457 RepID=UPI001C00382A|nr:FAD-dependent oxidoreductase [Nocardioides sp. LMS-CY]QWF22011.1 FAD-dependent oxidoreductase [Nocardioides sp. LMS-CY]